MTALEDRFWAKVDKSGDCWLWTGARDRQGYGRFGVKGINCLAHRVAYALIHGTEPFLLICHHCDKPACVNPAHLFIGTDQDNSRDMVRKGRQPSKPGKRWQKLNPEGAQTIRTMRQQGATLQQIAKTFDVSERLVGRIIRYEIWR